MKKIKCMIKLHCRYKEILVGPYESISAAKEWLLCWDGPYTIVKLNA